MALDDVAAEPLVGARRQLQVDGGAGRERADHGHLERLVHRLGGETRRVGLGRREADAVDGDRVAEADLLPQLRRDAKARAVGAALDALDTADVLHQSGEHHHSLNRVRIKVSSPTSSASVAVPSRRVGMPGAGAGPPSSSGAMKTRASSIWSAAAKAAVRVAPPSSRRLVRPRRPSSSSAAVTRPVAASRRARGSSRRRRRAALRAAPGRRRGRGRRSAAPRRASPAAASRAAGGRRSRRRRGPAGALRRPSARSAAGRRRGRCRSRPRSRRIRRARRGPARGCARRRSRARRRPASWCGRRATSPSSAMTSGMPVSPCLRKGWLARRAARAISSVGVDEVDLHPARAQRFGPAPRRLRRSGRRWRSRRGRCRPRGSRRRRAAGGPWWAQGSSVT